MVRKLAEATGSITFSMRGEKGESGDTPYVTKTVVDYAITSSVSEKKNWSSTAPDASAAANKGKFLWTRTTYTWSNKKTTENITYTYIGKDGKDGTSVTIKASKNSTSELPTSGNTLGDGYIIDGYLWVYTGTSKTDSTHVRGFENVGKIRGEPGTPATQYYTHIAWMEDSNGKGFTTTAGGGEYAYVGVLVDKTPTDSEDWTKYDWSYVKGEKGDTGKGIKSTEVTYQIGSSGTEHPNGAWSPDIQNITDEKPFLWTRTIFKYTDYTESKPSYSVATRGTKGALMREHEGFESEKYKYLSGSGAEAYVDVVYINKRWWQCIITYKDPTSSPKLDDGHWKVMEGNYTSIATHLLLAENATINMLGTNQINLFNPTDVAADSKMYGSFRVVNDVNDWSLWLGGETGDSASFAVKKSGYLKGTNVDISGRINATSGSIGGFEIGNYTIGTVGKTEGMGLTNERLKFMNYAYLHGLGYYITIGDDRGAGLRIDSTTSDSNDISKGIWVDITAGTATPSDKMCTALDLRTLWADQAGSFDKTNPFEGNHAIVIRGGDVIGLRPSFVRIATSYELTEYNHTIECYNTTAITLTLPKSPMYGQCYTIIQRGSRIVFSSDKGIYDTRTASSVTTWYSDTRGQVSWLWYNGNQWIVSYVTR